MSKERKRHSVVRLPLDVTARILAERMATGSWKAGRDRFIRSEEHTSELQSQSNLVCRLLLEKKKKVAVQPLLCYCGLGRSEERFHHNSQPYYYQGLLLPTDVIAFRAHIQHESRTACASVTLV